MRQVNVNPIATESDPHLEYGLPAWPDAEKTILGSILIDNRLIVPALEVVRPSHFYLSWNRNLFKSMFALHHRGYPIALETLWHEMERAGTWQGGDETKISALVDHAVINIDTYLRLVYDAAVLRDQNKVGNEIVVRSLKSRDPKSVQSFAERRLSEIHSAVYRDVVAAESILPFQSAKEIAAQTQEGADWIAKPWIAKGAITEIDGKVKAAGKTTFITHLCRQVLSGEPFLEQPTKKTAIVYLTEQSRSTFREALRRAGLLEFENLRVLFWHDTIGVSWPDVVKAAVSECKRVGAEVLITDTLGQFAGLRGDSENNSGDALVAIRPLQEAAARGLAVVISRHERKGGGEVGDSARGSSAFAGAVDVVMQIRRAEGNAKPEIRVINALSRFDETPDTLAVELTPEGYKSLGSVAAVAVLEAREALLDLAPSSEDKAMTLEELREAADLKRTAVQDAVKELVGANLLARTGAGKKGNPYRFWRPSEAGSAPDGGSDIHSAATSTLYTSERKKSVGSESRRAECEATVERPSDGLCADCGAAEAPFSPKSTGDEPGRAAASESDSPPSAVASVRFMVTRDMQQQLADLGYKWAQIDAMTPDDAAAVIEAGIMAAGESREVLEI